MVATRGYLRHAAVPFAVALAVLVAIALVMRVTVPGWARFMPYYVAVAAPLAYLYVAHRVDCYRSSRTTTIVACTLMGVAFALFAQFLVPLESRITSLIMLALVAPLLEESLKVLPVFTLSRRDIEFEYVLPSAVAGFAVGMGFAAGESLVLLLDPEARELLPDVQIAVAVSRALTTTLMHGATAAMTSVATSMNRADTPSSVNVSGRLVGFSGAVFLHIAYNVVWLTSLDSTLGSHQGPGLLARYSSSFILWALVLGGLLLTLSLVRVGLIEQRRLVTSERLLQAAGVSSDEAEVLELLPTLRSFLNSVKAKFGADTKRLMREFVYALTDLLLAVHQAQLLHDQKENLDAPVGEPEKAAKKAERQALKRSAKVDALRRDMQVQYDHLRSAGTLSALPAVAKTGPAQVRGDEADDLVQAALHHWKASRH